MVIQTLSDLFERDLQKLKAEINLYKEENNLWMINKEISNSAGNLCLHLIGNLNHFIGAALGGTGYVRKRDDEFSLKNIPRQDITNHIDDCIQTVRKTFSKLTDADLVKDFPLEKDGKMLTNTQMLLHLFGHLSYHLGQINYHRRLLD